MADVTAEQVWATVDSVLGKSADMLAIDSAFSFALHERGFVESVERLRRNLFNAPEPPYAADAEGRAARGRWIQNFDWHLKAIPPAQYEERRSQYYGELKRLSEEYNLPRWTVDHYIFFGSAPQLSPLRVIVREGADTDAAIEIRVLSSAVTGEDVKRFYDGLRERETLPALAYDRPLDGSAPDLVRTWAVHVLTNHGPMSVEEAQQAWNERYPAHAASAVEQEPAFRRVLRRIQGITWGANRGA
ncbi:MAG: hypothetical protein J4F32_00120 [Dehalococcoidia bacterium]|nr:hypothetical protein [Dehalococcoidia bacterium]